jgi:DNA-directed RNA polymerase sigma subunit (sigma70/sigma32)
MSNEDDGKDPNVERDAAIQRAVLDGATLDELAARHFLTRERIRQIAYKDPAARERVRLGLEES